MSRFNPRHITKRQSYSFGDMQRRYGINRATWKRWLKKGLVTLENGARPVLVMGFDLTDFFAETKTSEFKGKLGPEGFPCKTCHAVVMGVPSSIRVEPTGHKIGKNNKDQMIRRATCEGCGSPLRRFVFIGEQDYAGADSHEEMPRIKVSNNQKQKIMRPLHKNELIKRTFFDYLQHAKERSEGTIKKHEQALWYWEDFSQHADFAVFNKQMAIGFKEWFAKKKKAGSDTVVSVSLRYDMLRSLRLFFEWLSRQKKYRNISPDDIEYLSPSKAETGMAHQAKPVKFPSLEETRTLIESIPIVSEVDRRDKAAISLLSAFGPRVRALQTLTMKCFDREALILRQDPVLGVETKNSKAIISYLRALSYPERLTHFLAWFDYLQNERGFGPDDPIFPTDEIKSGLDNNVSYRATGRVTRNVGKSTSIIRKMLIKRCAAAGVGYCHPHAFRHALAYQISKAHLTEEEKKAFSQNYFGHKHSLMTFGTDGYGRVPEVRQIEIMKGFDLKKLEASFGSDMNPEEIAAILEQVALKFMKKDDLNKREST
jgi:integrase